VTAGKRLPLSKRKRNSPAQPFETAPSHGITRPGPEFLQKTGDETPQMGH
jgi:hypothetical protein